MSDSYSDHRPSVAAEARGSAQTTSRDSPPSAADAGQQDLTTSLPPLHSLVAFEAIARHRSISAAARDLGVTRSALAHSINVLEHRLQVRLFRRTHPVVELSRVGLRYLDAVQDFARGLGDSLYRLSPDARTTLRLIVRPEIGRLWLGARLANFHALHPRIDLNVTLLDNQGVDFLERADVVLQYGAERRPDVRAMPLWRETIVALATPEIARQSVAAEVPDLLQRFPLIEVTPFSWSTWAEGPLARHAARQSKLVTHDVVFALEMATQGLGIVLAPMRLASRYVQQGQLSPASRIEVGGQYYEALTLESNASRLPVAAFLGWLAGEVHNTHR